jgi:hypothetical protein
MKIKKSLFFQSLALPITLGLASLFAGCNDKNGPDQLTREAAIKKAYEEAVDRAVDLEIAEKAKEKIPATSDEVASVLTCGVSYAEQLAMSEKRVAEALKLKCFDDAVTKDEVENLGRTLAMKVSAFKNAHAPRNEPPKSASMERAAFRALKAELKDIATEYQRLQEQLARCRVMHILQDANLGIVFDSKDENERDGMLLHVLGDVFGHEAKIGTKEITGVVERLRSLQHRANALRAIKAQMAGHVFVANEKQSRPCGNSKLDVLPAGNVPHPDIPVQVLDSLVETYEMADKLSAAYIGPIEDFHSLLKKQLAHIPAGRSVFFVGGDKTHAVFYLITKELPAGAASATADASHFTYTFKIYNSGKGIDAYHQMSISGFKEQVFPFVEMTKVPFINMTSIAFLKALHEITQIKLEKAGDLKSLTFLYEKILPSLGGVPATVAYNPAMFADWQTSGTCSYYPQSWVVNTLIGQIVGEEKASSQFMGPNIEFLIGLKTLRDYHASFAPDVLAQKAERVNLVAKAMTYFSSSIMGAMGSFGLDSGSVSAATRTQAYVLQTLTKAHLDLEKKEEQKNPELDLKAPPPTLFSPLIQTLGGVTVTPLVAGALSIGQKPVAFRANWVADEDIKKRPDELATLIGELDGLRKSEQWDGIVQLVKRVALGLPLESRKWDGWTMPAQRGQLDATITNISSIAEYYLFAFFKEAKSKGADFNSFSPADLIVVIKLLAVADMLNQKYPLAPPEAPPIPSMVQPKIIEFLSNPNGDTMTVLEIRDVRWADQLRKLREFYSADKHPLVGRSFFGLEDLREKKSDVNDSERRGDWAFKTDDKGADSWPARTWAREWLALPGRLTEELKAGQAGNIWDQYLAASPKLGDNPRSRYYIDDIEFSCNNSRVHPDPVRQEIQKNELRSETDLKDILLHRESVRMMLQENRLPTVGHSLPSVYFALESLSVVTDLFLAGSLEQGDTYNWIGGAGARQIRSVEMSRYTTNRTLHVKNGGACQYKTRERKFKPGKSWSNYDDDNDFFLIDDKKKYDWNTNPFKYFDVWTPYTFMGFSRTQLNTFSYEVFGRAAKDRKRDTSPSIAKRLEASAQPFKKYDSDTQFTKFTTPAPKTDHARSRKSPAYHHAPLLKVFTHGLDALWDEGLRLRLKRDDTAPIRRRESSNKVILKQPMDAAEQLHKGHDKQPIPPPNSEGKARLEGLSLERMRMLFGISSNRRLQVPQTIGVFNKWPQLLTLSEYQRAFEKLTAENDILIELLSNSAKDSEVLIKLLAKFCRERLARFKGSQDYHSMAFVLYMNELYRHQAKFVQIQTGEGGATPTVSDAALNLLMDGRKEAQDIIDSLSAARQKEKSLFYRVIAQSFNLQTTMLTPLEIGQLLTAFVYHKMVELTSDAGFHDADAEKSIADLLKTRSPEIQRHLTNHEGGFGPVAAANPLHLPTAGGAATLSAVVQKAIGNAVPAESWRSSREGSTLFVADYVDVGGAAKKVELNVLTGKIGVDGRYSMPCPVPEDRLRKAFAVIPGFEIPEAVTEFAAKEYQWHIDSIGQTLRAREIGKEYVFQRTDLRKAVGAPPVRAWFQYLPQKEVERLSASRGFFPGYDYWQSEGASPEIHVYKRGTSELVYVMEMHSRDLVRRITRMPGGEVAVDIAPGGPLRLFEHIESWQHVYAWTKAGVIAEIELPRLGLKFEYTTVGANPTFKCTNREEARDEDAVKDDGEPADEQDKVYVVSKRQYLSHFGAPINYLVCEAALAPLAKPLLVLMPMWNFKPHDQKQGGLSLQFNIDTERNFDTAAARDANAKSTSVFFYRVHRDMFGGDRNVQPITEKAKDAPRYYMALRHLWLQQYRKAASAIKSYGSELRHLSNDETAILEWIRDGNPADRDVRSFSVRLLAYYWLAKDKALYSGEFDVAEDEGDPKKTKPDEDALATYMAFLKHAEKVDSNLLGLFEEKRLALRLLQFAKKLQQKQHDANLAKGSGPHRNPYVNQVKQIENRIVALEAYAAAEDYEPEVQLQESPSRKELQEVASILDEAGAEKIIEEMFLKQKVGGADLGPGDKKYALDCTTFIESKNFELLYKIAAGEAFDDGLASTLLSRILGVTNATYFAGVPRGEIRRQFAVLIHFAAIERKVDEDGKPVPVAPHRKWARFLDFIFHAADREIPLLPEEIRAWNDTFNNYGYGNNPPPARKKVKTWSQMQADFLKVPALEKEDDALWKAYRAIPDTEKDKAIKQEAHAKWLAKSREYREAKEAIPLYLKSLKGVITDAETDQLAQIKTASGSVRFERQKPLSYAVPMDIATTRVPLQEAAANDPLARSVFDVELGEKLSGLIKIQDLDANRAQEIDQNANSLVAVFERASGARRDISSAVEGLKESIRQYARSLIRKKKTYDVVNLDGLKTFRASLVKKRQELLERDAGKKAGLKAANRLNLENLAEGIMNTIVQDAEDLKGGAVQKLLHMADGGSRQIVLDDLIYLLMKGKLGSFYELFGRLKRDDAVKAYKDLVTYLMYNTYAQHLDRLQKAIKKVTDAVENNVPSTDPTFRLNLDNMMLLGKDKRHYAVGAHVEYLILEHFMNILIRRPQAKALERLDIRNGVIHNVMAMGALIELIPGAGKTSVILPLLSAMAVVNGAVLNVVMLPESLVASMAEELQGRMQSAFGRGIEVLQVKRSVKLSEAGLDLLLHRLERAKAAGRTIVTTNSAIQSLFLSFIEKIHLHLYSKDANVAGHQEAVIGRFLKLFRFLKSNGRLTIDEIDLALDILQAHQYSVGDDPKRLIDMDILKVMPHTVVGLYHLIAVTPDLKNKITLEFLKSSSGKPLTAKSYKEFKPILVDAILAASKANQFFTTAKATLGTDLANLLLDANSHAAARQYLTETTASARANLFAKIDAKFTVKEHSDRVKDIFAVLYDELNGVFELTAGKKLNVHYGPLPAPVRGDEEPQKRFEDRERMFAKYQFVAIPYHSGAAMESSRFQPLETLNYTMQLHLQTREAKKFVLMEIEEIKALALKQSAVAQAAFNKRQDRLLPKPRTYNVHTITPAQIDLVVDRLQLPASFGLLFEIIENLAISQVRAYPTQLHTSAQIYESLFLDVQGFTGTIWNHPTYPRIFKNPHLSNTMQKTLFILWEQRKNSPVRAIPNVPPVAATEEARLKFLVGNIYNGPFSGSLMDEGGILRGFSNEDVAKQIRALGRGMDKVIFYDEEDKIQVWSGAAASPIEKPQRITKNRVAFWDKKHTTGSDMRLTPTMKAVMTFDHHLNVRSLTQTVWRLRQLEVGQTMGGYLAFADSINVMLENLANEWGVSVPASAPFDLGTLMLYSVVSQEARLGELRFRALRQKMNNVFVRMYMRKMFDEHATPAQVITMYPAARFLFEKQLGEQPLHIDMGRPLFKQPVANVLANIETDILRRPFADGLRNRQLFPMDALLHARWELRALVREEQGGLPELVNGGDADSEQEIEIETEQEQENETEQEQEAETHEIDASYTPHKVVAWDLDKAAKDPALILKGNFLVPTPIANLSDGNLPYGNMPPIVSIGDALSSQGNEALATVFDDNIYLSLNFAPLHYNGSAPGNHAPFKFFDVYNKDLDNVLVQADKDGTTYKMVFIDENDFAAWDAFITKRNKAGAGAWGDVWYGLYNLSAGFHRESSNVDDAARDALVNNPQFKEALVQAKFYAGFLDYEDAEIPLLRNFLTGPLSAGAQAMRDRAVQLRDMMKLVLSSKEDSRRGLRGSTLAEIVGELAGEL